MSKKSLRLLDKKLQHLQGPRDVRRQHQLGARRRHQEPRGRAHHQQPRARARLLHLDRHHPRRLGPAEAARSGRAQGLRRGVGRDQRAAGRSSRISIRGFAAFRTTWRTASRTTGAAAPARAISTSARTAWCTTARSSAATRACRSRRYTIDDIRREFATPKSCAPYCTVGCVHRVSTMDFWRSPQDADRPKSISARQSQDDADVTPATTRPRASRSFFSAFSAFFALLPAAARSAPSPARRPPASA